ncbi:MAG TPA: hypothetical protein DCR16_01585 [Lachnospiraceae bacterium]|nr:hypothetical protein [Lachnospiraceae bacterium]
MQPAADFNMCMPEMPRRMQRQEIYIRQNKTVCWKYPAACSGGSFLRVNLHTYKHGKKAAYSMAGEI